MFVNVFAFLSQFTRECRESGQTLVSFQIAFPRATLNAMWMPEQNPVTALGGKYCSLMDFVKSQGPNQPGYFRASKAVLSSRMDGPCHASTPSGSEDSDHDGDEKNAKSPEWYSVMGARLTLGPHAPASRRSDAQSGVLNRLHL